MVGKQRNVPRVSGSVVSVLEKKLLGLHRHSIAATPVGSYRNVGPDDGIRADRGSCGTLCSTEKSHPKQAIPPACRRALGRLTCR